MADGLNHAILTQQELEQGLGRLRASGLVEVSEDGICLTRQGESLSTRRKGGMFGQVGSLHRLLRAEKPLHEDRFPLTPAAVEKACQQYLRRIRG